MIEHDDNTSQETKELKYERETKAAKLRRIKAAWDRVLASEDGRAVVWDIIGRGGIMETPAKFGAVDATFHAIGRQDLAREIYTYVGSGYPTRLLEMEKENMR